MHIVYNNNYNNNNLVDIFNSEYVDGPLTSKRMIIGSFSMFLIFSYLKLLYILVAIYLALHHVHI
ncbi:PREDICTED: uncharacterized protein LOC108613934 [Drosophila arizonae]|uniref:Uncharacterized protein LOC108613934 n=2 Tax=mojavensis species complex TaxID=198037 RepID=A0ABM1P7P3_DROAR|nr:PREDICTED: uncharacterized protein LOC108613934 [Drosophila arizonae]